MGPFEHQVRRKRASFCAILYLKMIILPRQARDKHRESTQKETRFLPFEHQTFPLDNGDRFVGGLIATNLVQYFDATQDASFLHEKLLPLLRGVADFYLSYAVSSASAIFGPFGVRHGAPSSERSLPFTCAQEVCHGGGGGARNGP